MLDTFDTQGLDAIGAKYRPDDPPVSSTPSDPTFDTSALDEIAKKYAPAKAPAMPKSGITADRERFIPPGAENWSINDFDQIGSRYRQQFGAAIPTAAYGQGKIHNSQGWDHRNAVDIPVDPNSDRGKWILNDLRSNNVPFQAMYRAIKNPTTGRISSTGPHIHVGLPSHSINQTFPVGTRAAGASVPPQPTFDTSALDAIGAQYAPQTPDPADTPPVPEKPATLDAQFKSAQDPDSPKAAVLVTPGERPRVIPDGFDTIDTPKGPLYINRTKAPNATADDMDALLGTVEPVSDTSKGVAVVGTDKNGVEVEAKAVRTPQGLQAQKTAIRAMHPGVKVSVQTPRAVIAARTGVDAGDVEYWLGVPAADFANMPPDAQQAALRVAGSLHSVDLDRTKNHQPLQPKPTPDQQAEYRANAGFGGDPGRRNPLSGQATPISRIATAAAENPANILAPRNTSVGAMRQADDAAIRTRQIIDEESRKSGPDLPPLAGRLKARGVTPDTLQSANPASRTPFLDTKLVPGSPGYNAAQSMAQPVKDPTAVPDSILEGEGRGLSIDDIATMKAARERLAGKPTLLRQIGQQAPRIIGETLDEIGNLEQGVTDTLGVTDKENPNELAQYLQNRAQIWNDAANYRPVEEGLPATISRKLIEQGFNIGKLMSISGATGLSLPTIMAGEAYAGHANKGQAEALKEAGKAYALGKVFEYVPGGRAGSVASGAAIGATQAYLNGGSAKDILAEGISLGAFALPFKGQRVRDILGRDASPGEPNAAETETPSVVPAGPTGKENLQVKPAGKAGELPPRLLSEMGSPKPNETPQPVVEPITSNRGTSTTNPPRQWQRPDGMVVTEAPQHQGRAPEGQIAVILPDSTPAAIDPAGGWKEITPAAKTATSSDDIEALKAAAAEKKPLTEQDRANGRKYPYQPVVPTAASGTVEVGQQLFDPKTGDIGIVRTVDTDRGHFGVEANGKVEQASNLANRWQDFDAVRAAAQAKTGNNPTPAQPTTSLNLNTQEDGTGLRFAPEGAITVVGKPNKHGYVLVRDSTGNHGYAKAADVASQVGDTVSPVTEPPAPPSAAPVQGEAPTSANRYEALRATDQKDYVRKTDFLQGYLDLDKQFGLELDNPQFKSTQSALDKTEQDLSTQVDQGAKHFKISPDDFIGLVNEYETDSGAIKQVLLPASQPAPDTELESAPSQPVTDLTPPVKGPTAQVVQRPVDESRALTVKTPKGTTAQYEPKVVDESDLITSTDPRFPQELQTKDIAGNKASKAQIAGIAAKLDPDLLDNDIKAGSGRPLVVPVEVDGETKYAVVSGNHRAEAIRGAYEAGGEPGKAYEAFARGKGETDAQRPVHVGVLDTSNLDVKQFAREANAPDIGVHNPVEQGYADAERLDSHAMSLFVPSEDGSIHGAANRKFLTKFFDGMTDEERRPMFQENGDVSNAGLDRVKNALIAKAFGDSKGLVERIISSPDNDIRRITNAMLQNTSKFADFKQKVADGIRHPDLDITPDITKAVTKLADLKSDGGSVPEYLAQQNMFGRDLTPFQEEILKTLDTHKNSSKALKTIFDNYLDYADNAGDPRQEGLMGAVEHPNAHEIFKGAAEYYAESKGKQPKQASLTDRPQEGANGQEVPAGAGPRAGDAEAAIKSLASGKPVETEYPQDETEPAESVAARDRKGERGAADLMAPARALKAFMNYVSVEPTPELKRSGLGQDARVHAAARISVRPVVNDLLSQVFPDEYHDPEAMAKTADILNKDDILGGYNYFLQKAQDATANGDADAATRWQQRAADVGSAADIAKLYREVDAARNDPKISANIDRWKNIVNPYLDQLYNKMKGVDPNTPREGRGLLFGARVNLLPEARAEAMRDFGNLDKDLPETTSVNYRNPNVKRDPFDRAAKFTGRYSTDPQAILTNVLGTRLNETTKLDFYKAIEDKGMGVMQKPGDAAPAEINGEKAVRLPVNIPMTGADGHTHTVSRALYVAKSIATEVQNVLNTDQKLRPAAWSKLLTQLQVAQLADATAHLKNLQTVLANAPATKTVWGQIARKFPGVGTTDSIVKLAQVGHEVMQDGPAIRKEIAEMAKRGLIRPEYDKGIPVLKEVSKFIHKVDTASRITMNRFFDKMVEAGRVKDTPQNRASFVQQIGEYNDRLMGPLMQKAKQSGLSTFIVAGRNFNRQGMRLITGNPGVEGANAAEAAKLRAGNLIGLLVAVGAVPAMLNTMTTGSVGGRPGTKIGAWDLGMAPDDKGKHKVVDIAQLLGYRRGMRILGIDALLTGLQEGQSKDEIAGHAVEDSLQAVAHPWMGPALGFGVQAVTGHRLDLRGGPEPQEARNVGGGKQYLENMRVALKNQNPLLYNLASPLIGTDAENLDASYGKRIASGLFKSPASAAGISDVDTPAMKLANEINHAKGSYTIEPDKEKARATARSLVARANNGEDVDAEIQKAIEDGSISTRQVRTLTRNKNLSPLAVKVKYMSLIPDAMRVYQRASKDEKADLAPLLLRKAARAKLSDADGETLKAMGLPVEKLTQ